MVPVPALAARTAALLPIQAPAFTPPHLVQGIEEAVRDEIAGLQHARLQMESRTQNKAPICQQNDVSCFIELGQKLDVQQLLFANLSGEGDQIKISIVAYDISARVVEGKIESILPPGLDAAKKRARNLVVELLDPGSAVGSLLIRTLQPGAEVFIDGVAYGKTPLAGPIHRITEGRHLVRLRLLEHQEYEAFVQVHRGTELSLEIQLQKKTDKTAKVPPGTLTPPKKHQTTTDVPDVVKRQGLSPLFFAGGAAMGVGTALLLSTIGVGVTGAVFAGLPVRSVKAQVEQARNVYTAWGTAAVLGVASSILLGAGAVALAVPLLAE
ncbi:MAG: PEGA domain-containing protein [Deltaproteobacteria bacterium]|nr:PEGA domain-containing protein [Deltaproteobacteria bacterium]